MTPHWFSPWIPVRCEQRGFQSHITLNFSIKSRILENFFNNYNYHFCRFSHCLARYSFRSWFDGFGYFLVFLNTIWRTTTTNNTGGHSPCAMLTILTYAHCDTIVWTYHADQRHQRSIKDQQRTEKTRNQCHGLLTFVTTLFTLNNWHHFMSKSIHLLRKSN